MESMLEKLFNGDVIPVEQVVPDTEEYRENLRYHTINDELMKKQLGEISDKLLQRYEDLKYYQYVMREIELEAMFTHGFRLGLRLAAEAFLG